MGHLVSAVAGAEQRGDKPAKALVGEAGAGVDDTAQGTGQGHGAYMSEPQSSGPLALPCVGLVDALRERRRSVAGVGDVVVARRNHRHPCLSDGEWARNRDRFVVPATHQDGAMTVTALEGNGEVVVPAGYVARPAARLPPRPDGGGG